jgi:hypothetical protein
MKCILVLIALSMPLVVGASDQTNRWLRFFDGVEGSHSYLDIQTLDYRSAAGAPAMPDSAAYATVWVKSIDPSRTLMMRLRFHHASRQNQALTIVAYSPSGERLGSKDTPGAWEETVPDSMADVLFQCLFGPDKSSEATRF